MSNSGGRSNWDTNKDTNKDINKVEVPFYSMWKQKLLSASKILAVTVTATSVSQSSLNMCCR